MADDSEAPLLSPSRRALLATIVAMSSGSLMRDDSAVGAPENGFGSGGYGEGEYGRGNSAQ